MDQYKSDTKNFVVDATATSLGDGYEGQVMSPMGDCEMMPKNPVMKKDMMKHEGMEEQKVGDHQEYA